MKNLENLTAANVDYSCDSLLSAEIDDNAVITLAIDRKNAVHFLYDRIVFIPTKNDKNPYILFCLDCEKYFRFNCQIDNECIYISYCSDTCPMHNLYDDSDYDY